MMAGAPFDYRIRRSPRARRVRVSVDGTGEVEVVLPRRAPERAAAQAVRERAHRRGDDLLVPRRHAEAAVERWYRRHARAEIGPRLDAAVGRAGTAYTGLTIRGQKTRWASCSSTGH